MLLWLLNPEMQIVDTLFLSDIAALKRKNQKSQSVSFYICLFRDAGIMILPRTWLDMLFSSSRN